MCDGGILFLQSNANSNNQGWDPTLYEYKSDLVTKSNIPLDFSAGTTEKLISLGNDTYSIVRFATKLKVGDELRLEIYSYSSTAGLSEKYTKNLEDSYGIFTDAEKFGHDSNKLLLTFYSGLYQYDITTHEIDPITTFYHPNSWDPLTEFDPVSVQLPNGYIFITINM